MHTFKLSCATDTRAELCTDCSRKKKTKKTAKALGPVAALLSGIKLLSLITVLSSPRRESRSSLDYSINKIGTKCSTSSAVS